MYHDLRKKSLINIGALCMCVHVCVCACVCACVCVWEGEVFHITPCLVCELE